MWMLGSHSLFQDRQRALVERRDLGVAALGLVEYRQVVEVSCQVGMVRAKSFLVDPQSALIERLGLRVVALSLVE